MAKKEDKPCTALEEALHECRRADALAQRQVALLKAIIRVFRETLPCETEEDVARICLKVAEELTGSAFGSAPGTEHWMACGRCKLLAGCLKLARVGAAGASNCEVWQKRPSSRSRVAN